MTLLIYLAAIAAGLSNPVQTGASAQLRKSLDHPLFSAACVYLGGLLTVLLIQLVVRQAWPGSGKFGAAPWWAWCGGVLSVAATMAGILLAQKLGSGVFTGISVTAAILTSLALDNFGLLGFKQHPASIPRLMGGVLMVAGVWLVSKF